LEALRGYENGDVAVKDVFVIPDYAAWLTDNYALDEDLGRMFKEPYTQHIIKFLKTTKSDLFPLGVKVQI